MLLPIPQINDAIKLVRPYRLAGRVTGVSGLLVEGSVPGAQLGMICQLQVAGSNADTSVPAEVVAINQGRVSLMPLGGITGIQAGASIQTTSARPILTVGDGLLGRVLDGWGNPLDGRPLHNTQELYPLDPAPMNPLLRSSITQPLSVGVRAVDGMLTCGMGQRMAILAGAGVGKSTLLGMMCRNTEADVTVIGLIGERGREVKHFIEKDLGPEGLKSAVVVAATSDHAPALRVRAARVATTIAEYFRDQGKRVLLLVDSLSRVAMAQRELGLSVGEPPATKGYPPSAFTIIPRLLERAGPGIGSGSITAFYTTLLEGDDLGDPIGDAVKATTDGHIVLSRALADRGHFPAIDILSSTSRVMNEVVTDEHRSSAMAVRNLIADHREVDELATIGAYQRGTRAEYDTALDAWPHISSYLRQPVEAAVSMNDGIEGLHSLTQQFGGAA
ncbi:MAG: FliI/YscN family ATPase [Myxococcota bacterium]|nr:FliI/YscN family ATPase [Myxococcota bacterium]